MEGGQEFRFSIGAYTPETMPLGRLAEYLAELARLLGQDHAIHLVELDSGSTVLVYKIDAEVVPKIRERAEAVRRRDAPVPAMRSYDNLNKLLRDDAASASLLEDGAEILEFPGKKNEIPHFPTVSERGEIDGEVVRVGGISDPVPIMLTTDSGTTLSGCYAGRPIAKQLAQKLFEPVRLFGEGRWSRTAEGRWLLNYFRIDHFQGLASEGLADALTKLRAIPGIEWGDKIVDELLSLRHGEGDPNGGV
ncbi:MAG: hypothetical protein L0Y57_03280 [Beijerinckiaceae bacterium]|nr:hypothetical protein [Beijerinckiaceae bacterium]